MSIYSKNLYLPRRLLLGPGPSNIHPRVLQAMMTPVLGHLDPDFWPVLDGIRTMLSSVMGASNDNWTFPLPATGMAGMEAAFCNVVEPGDQIIIAVNGFFGERMVEVVSRLGGNVRRIDIPWGKPVLPEHIHECLRVHGPAKAVGVVHAATSTGVLSPIQDISEVVHNHDALLIVDAVTSLGGLEFRMDDWNIDVCYGASQKCLGAPSGAAPVSFSPVAQKVIRNRKTKIQSFYLDVFNLEKYWSATRVYHHTTPILTMYAFHEALRLIMEEGLENQWQRHSNNAHALRAGILALELELFADANYRLDPLTTIRVPKYMNAAKVVEQLYKDYNIEIGSGLGVMTGKIWRIGLMGESSKASNVLFVLSALEKVLAQHGHPHSNGRGVAAAQKALFGH